MKKNVLLLIFTFLLTANGFVYAQETAETFGKNLHELFLISPVYRAGLGSIKELIKGTLEVVNEELLKDSSRSKELVDKYSEDSLAYHYMTSLYEVMMKEHVTDTELKELSTLLMKPEVKLYVLHSLKQNILLEFMLTEKLLTELLTEDIKKNSNNVKFDFAPVKVNSEIPSEYISAFNDYYEYRSKKDEIKYLTNYFKVNPLVNNVNSKLHDQLMNYFKVNMRSMYLNSCYASMTIQDLQVGCKFESNSLYIRLEDVLKESASRESTIIALSKKILKKYAEWLKEQGVEINDINAIIEEADL
ncbi:MAG: hypothetical protein IKA00_06595 [Prevotella sp.]|nr:hypothetical protein [Prevotella sp.]